MWVYELLKHHFVSASLVPRGETFQKQPRVFTFPGCLLDHRISNDARFYSRLRGGIFWATETAGDF